jgi:5-bromo-4-chloroindolyl phosphate hydrolysis protein
MTNEKIKVLRNNLFDEAKENLKRCSKLSGVIQRFRSLRNIIYHPERERGGLLL